MFPVNDFNFVVAGIATFAATVGYACTRKFGAALYDHLSVDEISNRFCDIRSGPVSLHEAGLEQVQEKGSAEASSSNFDDTQDQNTATSILSRQESMKRKVPDDGFDGDNVRISFLLLLCWSGI